VNARRSWVWTLAGALAFAGCTSEKALGPDTETGGQSLAGTLAASDGRTGIVTMTTATAALMSPGPSILSVAGAQSDVINLSGSVALSDGTTATLAGTWDIDTGDLSVSGGGFGFTGTIVSGRVSGSFTGPGITGAFFLQVGTTSAELAVYCGTFTGRQPEDLPQGGTGTSPSNGTWNLVVGATTVSVVGIGGQDNEPFLIDGTRSGNSLTISVPGGSATGSLSGSSGEYVDGTYSTLEGEQGTFQGSKAACSATSETAAIASLTLNAPGLVPGNGRLNGDSTLAFVTARDAQGHFVAAPDLTWTLTAPLRSNTEVTARGQKWVVAYDLTAYPVPPVTQTGTVTVTSKNNPAVSVSANVVIYY